MSLSNREIKFKFLMEDGTVTEPYYLRELIDSDSYVNIECEWNSKIKQELQYTNRKDKNNVEIYEGDIIKGGVYLAYEVKWDHESNGWNICNEYNIRTALS